MTSKFIRYFSLIVFLTSSSFGQDSDNNFSIGFSGGYSQLNIENIIEFANQGDVSYENNKGGILISSCINYYLSPQVFLSLDVGYNNLSNNGQGEIQRTASSSPDIIDVHRYDGEYSVTLIPLSCRLFYGTKAGLLQFNFGLGLNYYWGRISLTNNFNNPVQVENESNGINTIEANISDSGIGFSVIVKPEISLSKIWSIFTELNYSYANILGQNSLSDKLDISINGIGLKIGVGLNL